MPMITERSGPVYRVYERVDELNWKIIFSTNDVVELDTKLLILFDPQKEYKLTINNYLTFRIYEHHPYIDKYAIHFQFLTNFSLLPEPFGGI
jgi:hypothetical protein